MHHRPKLGLKPTAADHTYVASLSCLGVGVREICRRMAERYGLAKTMARSTLYYHFRADIEHEPRGVKPKLQTLRRRANENLTEELNRMIAGSRQRGRGKEK